MISLADAFDPPTILMTYSNASSIEISLSPFHPSCNLATLKYTASMSPTSGTMRMINRTSFTFTGLNSNTSYSITVRAVSKAGNGRSASVTLMTMPGIVIFL